MQVKKFEAPTIQEALENIKRELGPEAVILQTKKNRKGFGLLSSGSVEVTVAVSDRSLHKKAYAEQRIPTAEVDRVRALPADRQSQVYERVVERSLETRAQKTKENVEIGKKKITATRYIDIDDEEGSSPLRAKGDQAVETYQRTRPPQQMLAPPAAPAMSASTEEEIKHLKRMIAELKSNQEQLASEPQGSGAQSLAHKPALATAALQTAFEELVVNGIDKKFAFSLVRNASFHLGEKTSENLDAVMDQLALEFMESTETLSVLPEPQSTEEKTSPPAVLAIVGPTGVGKTTTVAKIASHAIRSKGLKVGIINVDGYKVAAFDQIATYAKILGAPFRSVNSAEELALAIQDFKKLDLVLIDTTGRSQKETESLNEMQKLLSNVEGVRVLLMLAVATRDAELYEMGRRFAMFHPAGLVLSKLDEALVFGSIYNVSHRLKLPLVYFTTGQKVPDDFEEASKERMASLILDIE